MKEVKKVLVSIDFRSEKGGIARVANLMEQALGFDRIFSLHGEKKGNQVLYFNSGRMKYFFSVLYFILRKRPELVVFDHLNIARLLIFVPKRFLKQVVLFVYDEEVWEEVRGLKKFALNKTTQILCISDHSMQKFLKVNPEYKSKAKLCLLAGVPEKFLIQKQDINKEGKFAQWINDARPYCVFVSRLWKAHRYKGHFELLEAFKLHAESSDNPSMRLAIIGNGDDAENVSAYIKENNLSENIYLFQGVNDFELAEFYKHSSGLIFPSTREGFGFVFLEAMFFKKACVGIADQPAEEIIINNETGIILPDNKPETLKKVISDMESNPDKYRRFGNAGYERYLSHFTNEHFKNRFLKAVNYPSNQKI